MTGTDTPAFPWVWVILGVLVVAAAGGGAFWYLNNRKKATQQQMYQVPPTADAGYAPGQPPSPAPGQAPAPGSVPPPASAPTGPDYVQQGHDGAAGPGPVVPPSDNQPGSPTTH